MEIIKGEKDLKRIKESGNYVYLGGGYYPVEVISNTENYLEVSCQPALYYRRKEDGETIIAYQPFTDRVNISLWEDYFTDEGHSEPAKLFYTSEGRR